jgi:hypothetical protein
MTRLYVVVAGFFSFKKLRIASKILLSWFFLYDLLAAKILFGIKAWWVGV